MAVMVCSVVPSLTIFDVYWRVPYAMLGFLYMQAARRAGIKDIARPEKDVRIWRAWKKMQESGEEIDEITDTAADAPPQIAHK